MIYMSTRAPIIILASSSSPPLQIASSTASLYFHSDVGARDPFDLINFVDSLLRPFHEQFLFPFQNRDGRSLIAPQGSLVHPFGARSKPTPSGETVSTSRNTHYVLTGSRSTTVGVDEREGEQQSKLPRKSRVCAQDVRALFSVEASEPKLYHDSKY
jgi:hypothetical protein